MSTEKYKIKKVQPKNREKNAVHEHLTLKIVREIDNMFNQIDKMFLQITKLKKEELADFSTLDAEVAQ